MRLITTLALGLIPAAVMAQQITEIHWKDLPNQTLSYSQTLQINSPIFDDFHCNAPTGRINLTDNGLEFHTDGSESFPGLPDWVTKRAELRDNPMSVVPSGKTQVYEYEFEFKSLPHLNGPVTIFQRFHKGKDGPDLDVELKGDGQFPGSNPPNGSVLIHAFNDDWYVTRKMLKAKNHLVVAIYSHSSGHYKVSLNGETLAENDANTTPDGAYSGPQFGIYNHGGTYDRIERTDSRYKIAQHDGKADFSNINSIDPNDTTTDTTTPPDPTWTNESFDNQTGTFIAEFDAVPSADNMDGLAGISKGNAADYADLAAIIRFNSSGIIDVRNGDTYSADASVSYQSGTTYSFAVDINMSAGTYDVKVTPDGGSETTIATGFQFRTDQTGVASLDNIATYATSGAVALSNVNVTELAVISRNAFGIQNSGLWRLNEYGILSVGKSLKDYTLTLYAPNGEIVRTIKGIGGQKRAVLGDSFVPGMYFAHMESGNFKETVQIRIVQ